MIIKDFINKIINFDNIDNILDTYNTKSEKGLIFERLFDIIIKFGFCDKFYNSDFYHLIGNVNNAKLKKLTNFDKYLNEKVLSGNSFGVSDITLQNKNDSTYIFISSKYPKSSDDIKNTKNVDYYDIQNILAMIDDNKHIYKKYKIYLVVPQKNKVHKSNKSSKYITDEHILDKNDLNKYFLLFKQDIIKNISSNRSRDDKALCAVNNNWNNLYLTFKLNLNLRFHQELITNKTVDLINKGNKSFLWGCKCRSDKTFMVGGLIIKLSKLNILIITPAPTETISQFTDDLFHKYKDFDNFKIHNIYSSKLINNIECDNNNIFIISKQLLQKYINDKTIKIIKDLNLDIIVFDENHFTGTKDILNSYSSKNTVKIYLTATFNKPLKEWNIQKDCQMFWDIEDEQFCKNRLIDKLKEKHGDKYVDNALINNNLDSYNIMPELCLITTIFDNKRYENIKNIIQDSVYGFSFDALFYIQNDKFKYSNEIKTILQYISGDFKEINFPKNDKSIFSRINSINTRPIKTQIWFLPPNNINEISKKLKELMLKDNILNKYDIMIINSKVERPAKDIKDEITKNELIAHENNKLGLILLVGNMLSLGITLYNCDMVVLLNNTLSYDKIMQQMYRCMIEGKNKKYGFIVDLNTSRVLNTCISYNTNNLNIEDKLKYLINTHLINIDIDMFINKELDSDKLITKILEIWKNDPINNFKTLLRNLDNEFITFDNDIQKLINKSFMNNMKDKTILTIEINEDYQELPNGIEKIKYLETNNNNNDNNDTSKEKPDKIINRSHEDMALWTVKISFTKKVLPYIIPLICILTIKNYNKDFVKMLNDIQETNELLEIFNDQTLIWWNQKDLIKIIIKIINKYFNLEDSNTNNICINYKLSLQSLLDRPKDLLELINECLKPKTIEKKQYGEVFTPIKLVNEMLDKLPIEVWTNKNLKWLDPASGIGNFPIIVYLRLMDGLKEEIIDEKQRKKHILENMIYMCELNKKNIFISKYIFDINNEYKLNLYEGDSLKLDYYKEFNVKEFDVIVGNPPYNDNSENKGKGHTLWIKFVELSIKTLLSINGYLVFIHPSVWRQINHPCLNLIKDKQLLYLEIHNIVDGQKIFKCATRYDWYVLQNTEYINNTIIKSEDGKINNINLKKWDFIPNMMFNEIEKLINNNKNNRIILIHSESNYEVRKKWMSHIKTDEYIYPCIYSINKQNIISYKWSSKNDKGHFGISKFIFTNGSGFYCDINGIYGLTQWASGIEDIPENLYLIEKTFNSLQFNKIKDAIQLDSSSYNIKVMKLFKKDFYNDFITKKFIYKE
jgi:hypothetical protein